MQLSHTFPVSSAVFDDPNLVSSAGLVPVLGLAQRCGLHRLVADALTLSGPGAAKPAVKVSCLVAGMVAGADSIDDMDLLRHGAMSRLFDGVRAPSTLGTFLRRFGFGHVRQLDKVAAGLLANLAAHTPLLGDVHRLCLVDIDDTIRASYGYAKQGAGYGYSGVNGINALIATISTPTSAPVIAGTRLRRGSSNSTPRSSPPGRRCAGHRQGRRGGRAGDPAGRLRLLQRRRHRRRPPGRCDVLHHRPPRQVHTGGDRRHRRDRVDPDPLPERDLGRRRAAVHLRRRGRRGAVCGERQQGRSARDTRGQRQPADVSSDGRIIAVKAYGRSARSTDPWRTHLHTVAVLFGLRPCSQVPGNVRCLAVRVEE